MKVTLEGGPWDGHVLDIAVGREYVTLLEPEDKEPKALTGDDSTYRPTARRKYTYRRSTGDGDPKQPWVFKLT